VERQDVMGGVTAQYVCVHVPAFPAQARLRLRPDQSKDAVVVIEGEPPLQTACSANLKAQHMGVAAGMTRAELDAFPELIVLQRSAVEERATQAALLQMVAAFTPRVEVVPSQEAFVCVLDMAGVQWIFGDAERVIAAIAKAICSLGLIARLASSCNFHTSVCAAPFARSKPVVIPAGVERQWLGRLPVSALGLTPEQAERMTLWGVRTLRELADLPEVELVVRLGQHGKRLRQLAMGTHQHLMVPEEDGLAFEDAAEFDAPEDRLDSLLFVVGPMLDQMLLRAQAHAYSLASLTLTLALDGGGEHVRTLKPAMPLAERAVWLKLIHLDMQSHPPPAGVVGLRVSAEPGKRGKVQMGLFSPQLPEPTRLDVTLAQIEAMVGEGRIGSPRLLDTHHPQDFVVERFVVKTAQSKSEPPRVSAVLRRLRPPATLHMWFDAGSDRPNAFALEGRRYRVMDAFGPWRRSGEWWSQRVWSRDEWDVRAIAGETAITCLIVHDLLRHQWALEAFYD
jgi:protein ImuB